MLVPLEVAILNVAVARASSDQPDLYGFELAKLIAEDERAGKLVAHGTLYKALNRLAESGMLSSDWEDPEISPPTADRVGGCIESPSAASRRPHQRRSPSDAADAARRSAPSGAGMTTHHRQPFAQG